MLGEPQEDVAVKLKHVHITKPGVWSGLDLLHSFLKPDLSRRPPAAPRTFGFPWVYIDNHLTNMFPHCKSGTHTHDTLWASFSLLAPNKTRGRWRLVFLTHVLTVVSHCCCRLWRERRPPTSFCWFSCYPLSLVGILKRYFSSGNRWEFLSKSKKYSFFLNLIPIEIRAKPKAKNTTTLFSPPLVKIRYLICVNK